MSYIYGKMRQVMPKRVSTGEESATKEEVIYVYIVSDLTTGERVVYRYLTDVSRVVGVSERTIYRRFSNGMRALFGDILLEKVKRY